MKRKNITRLFSAAILSFILVTSVNAQDAYEAAYQEANDLILDENWSQAITAFQGFLRDNRSGRRIDDARFFICYAIDKQSPSSETAFKCFDEFLGDHGRSTYADDAQRSLIRIGQRLAREGNPEYGERIRSLRQADDEEVAIAALYALQNIGDDEALSTMMSLFDRTRSEEIQKKIVYAMVVTRYPARVTGQARASRTAGRGGRGSFERSVAASGRGSFERSVAASGRGSFERSVAASGRTLAFVLS